MNEEPGTSLLKPWDQIDFTGILLLILAAWLVIRLVEALAPRLAQRLPGRLRLILLPWVPVVRMATIMVFTVLILPKVINPSFESFIAIVGALGLAIGFAFKDYVSSLIASVITIYERPYRPGDWIMIDGVYGEVKSIGMRALRMVTPDDTVVIVPHQLIWNNSLHNSNDGLRDLMVVTDFYVHPQHDAAQVRQKLQEVALTSRYLNMERPVSVVVSEKPWGTHYRLKAYPLDSRDQFQFSSDLTVRGKEALQWMGVQPALYPAAALPAPQENGF